jgi:hypothetical protein
MVPSASLLKDEAATVSNPLKDFNNQASVVSEIFTNRELDHLAPSQLLVAHKSTLDITLW